MAEFRQLSRRVDSLEEAVRASPSSPAVLAGLASVDSVSELDKRTAELEASLLMFKGFLEDALAKLGHLEQKVVGVEAKVCRCASDCGGDSVVQIPESEVPEAPTQLTLTENPVFLETLSEDEDAEAAEAAEATETA